MFFCGRSFTQSSHRATHMKTCSVKRGNSKKLSLQSIISNDIIEDCQGNQSACNRVSAINDNVGQSESYMKSTWNEEDFPGLHSSDIPIVVNIKEEEDM